VFFTGSGPLDPHSSIDHIAPKDMEKDDESISTEDELSPKEDDLEVEEVDSTLDNRDPPPLDEMFDDLEEADEFVKQWAIDHGYCVVRRTSDVDKALYRCSRGGTSKSKATGKRKSSSRKCGCAFVFGVYMQIKMENKWKISHSHPTNKHTCPPIKDIRSLSQARRLPRDLEDIRRTLVRAGILDDYQIYQVLLTYNPNIAAYAKDIANLNYKDRVVSIDKSGVVNAVISFFGKNNYEYKYKRDDANNLTHLFFTHITLTALARQYHSIFIMDCTYRTNDYDLPLFNIVGVDCFQRTFNCGFCFMVDETEESYKWALEHFETIVLQGNSDPEVILTDQDSALINAVKFTYPNVFHQLCKWHINKNVDANCKLMFKENGHLDKYKEFNKDWHALSFSKSEIEFAAGWVAFQEKYNSICESAVNYLQRQWIPKKNKFVDYYGLELFLHHVYCTCTPCF
jgi:hypothetical protein